MVIFYLHYFYFSYRSMIE